MVGGFRPLFEESCWQATGPHDLLKDAGSFRFGTESARRLDLSGRTFELIRANQLFQQSLGSGWCAVLHRARRSGSLSTGASESRIHPEVDAYDSGTDHRTGYCGDPRLLIDIDWSQRQVAICRFRDEFCGAADQPAHWLRFGRSGVISSTRSVCVTAAEMGRFSRRPDSTGLRESASRRARIPRQSTSQSSQSFCVPFRRGTAPGRK